MSIPPNFPGIRACNQLPQTSPSVGGEVQATPPSSPPSNPQTPVIVANPNFLPPPPLLPRYNPYFPSPNLPPRSNLGSRLPSPAGRWDNFHSTPTYLTSERSFWFSRTIPIPITSTVSSHITGLGLSSGSDTASELSEEVFERAVVKMTWPAPPENASAAQEFKRLSKIKATVEFKLERVKKTNVTAATAEKVEKLLGEIQELMQSLAVDLQEDVFSQFESELEEDFAESCKSVMDSLICDIDKTDDEVREKIFLARQAVVTTHQQQPALHDTVHDGGSSVPQPNGDQQSIPTPGQQQVADLLTDPNLVQTSQLLTPAQTPLNLLSASDLGVVAKATVKFNVLLDMALETDQDMEEEAFNLNSANDEQVARLMQRTSEFKKAKEKIKNLHAEYREFTALVKPNPSICDPTKLDNAVRSAITNTDALIADLELEDSERGLATLLPRK